MALVARANPQVAVFEPDLSRHTVSISGISSKRIPELDGLRGIAIILVLLCHAVFFEFYSNSVFFSTLLTIGRLTWSGVDLFFVLSGFLIGGILLDAKESPHYFKTFYMRRAYRILPLYAALLAFFSIRFLTSHGNAGPLGNFSRSLIPWASYATFTQNIWMGLRGTLGSGTMAATWSLAVEEQFYLTIPLMIRKLERRQLTVMLLLIVVAAPLLRSLLLVSLEHGNYAGYVFTPCRADSLSLGVLCAILFRTRRWWELLLNKRRILIWITRILALALIPVAFGGDPESTTMVTIGYSLLAFFYTGCLLIAISGAGATLRRVLCSRVLMELGKLSYCTYLIHQPLMEGCRRVLGMYFNYSSVSTHFVGGAIGVLVALGVAKMSWTLLEAPLLRKAHAYRY